MNEQIKKTLKILPRDWRFKVQERLAKKGVRIEAKYVASVVERGFTHSHKIAVLKEFAEYAKEILDAEKQIKEDLQVMLAEVN